MNKSARIGAAASSHTSVAFRVRLGSIIVRMNRVRTQAGSGGGGGFCPIHFKLNRVPPSPIHMSPPRLRVANAQQQPAVYESKIMKSRSQIKMFAVIKPEIKQLRGLKG